MSLNHNQDASKTREQIKKEEQVRSGRKGRFNINNFLPKKDGRNQAEGRRFNLQSLLNMLPKRDGARKPKQKRIRVRLIPIWLRVILVSALIVASTLAGLYVGYGVIGEGNPDDAFNKSTWQHIIDLVEKE